MGDKGLNWVTEVSKSLLLFQTRNLQFEIKRFWQWGWLNWYSIHRQVYQTIRKSELLIEKFLYLQFFTIPSTKQWEKWLHECEFHRIIHVLMGWWHLFGLLCLPENYFDDKAQSRSRKKSLVKWINWRMSLRAVIIHPSTTRQPDLPYLI